MSDISTLSQQQAMALAVPFDPRAVRWKPQKISGNRALASAYVDARLVQDRLDKVLGIDGWQDDYEPLPDGTVICRLRCRFAGEWITKVDVGSPSKQPEEGDRRKAAFSDALKRAAVKYGIGRYLYRLPTQWVDYDPQKRQIVKPPPLPDWALPSGASRPASTAQDQEIPKATSPAQPPPVNGHKQSSWEIGPPFDPAEIIGPDHTQQLITAIARASSTWAKVAGWAVGKKIISEGTGIKELTFSQWSRIGKATEAVERAKARHAVGEARP